MDKAIIRFSGSRYVNIELDPKTKKAIITAEIDGSTLTGTVKLTAIKATKKENK